MFCSQPKTSCLDGKCVFYWWGLGCERTGKGVRLQSARQMCRPSGVFGPSVGRHVLRCQHRQGKSQRVKLFLLWKAIPHQPVDPSSAAVWRVLCPPQGYLLRLCLRLSLKTLSTFGECYFLAPLTAHLHVSAFATYIVCILLHGLLKSSAQRQGHNHLFAPILASTLKSSKLLLFPLDLFWKCLGFMTAQIQ